VGRLDGNGGHGGNRVLQEERSSRDERRRVSSIVHCEGRRPDRQGATGPRSGPRHGKSAANANEDRSRAFVFAALFPCRAGPAAPAGCRTVLLCSSPFLCFSV